MKIWSLLLVLAIFGYQIDAAPSSVTNEDIRAAILSLVHMVTSVEDKLERHEFRERALGDHLKKAISALDRRLKQLDPVKGTISRLDERLATVETILMQKDERERVQLQKTFDTVEDIQKNLPKVMDKIKSDIIETVMKPSQKSDGGNFEKLQRDLVDRISNVSRTTSKIESGLEKIQKDNENFKKDIDKSAENFDRVKKQLSSSELLLQKYEHRLSELNDKIPTEVIPIDYKEQKDLQTTFLKTLEAQTTNVDKILRNVQDLKANLDNLPNREDLERSENSTLDSLQEIKYETIRQSDKSTIILDAKLKDVVKETDSKHEDVIKAIHELSEMTEGLTENFANSYEQLKKEIAGISKVEQVMVQTADGVMDTKRRVEYGVHQIILEVKNLVKEHTDKVNATINDRFDMFELSVLDGESGALANLTSKIGAEIDQVWRQIGIMHQSMTASQDTLNKLQNQTDAYVNGSLNVMDSMKGKVGQITGRMGEVDENLNYLLGRLSLVTQEFNQIKTGLGKALDEIRGSFTAVQDKIKNTGPGPHNIGSNELDDNNNIIGGIIKK